MRYTYNHQVSPPGPFVYVSLQCVQTGEIATDVPAQIDTAADRTVIPGSLVARLGLIQIGELPVAGLGDRR